MLLEYIFENIYTNQVVAIYRKKTLFYTLENIILAKCFTHLGKQTFWNFLHNAFKLFLRRGIKISYRFKD